MSSDKPKDKDVSTKDAPAKTKPDAKAETKPEAKTDAKPAPAAVAPKLDERRVSFSELLPSAIDAHELSPMANDGRPHVRANAALAFAALGQPAPELAILLRDSAAVVAEAAAEAVTRLGTLARPIIPQITQACSGTQPQVTEAIVAAFADLVGKADDELIGALDVPLDLAMKSVIAACGKAGKSGIATLIKGIAHERSRNRINAIAGLGRFGKIDPDPALAALEHAEQNDPVPDVRTACKQAMLAIVAREKVVAVDRLPKNIPDFEERKLSSSELREYADTIDVDEMMFALADGRSHVKINGSRALGMVGDKAARAAKTMGLLLRDSVAQVRREAALALGKLGAGALDAAPDLVGALGDSEEDVVEAASDSLAGLGEPALDALIKGLDAGSEAHGLQVGKLIGSSPRAAAMLVDAFKSPAVNVQVNAALALGLLGKDKIGAGMQSLLGARTGGDARTRDAVRRAIVMIEGEGTKGPQALSVEGFEERYLALADLDKAKPELDKLTAQDISSYLQDGREMVRANAALAVAALGNPGFATSLGVLLRDDSPRVRLSAAQAIDKLGDASVVETGNDLVGALATPDPKVAEHIATILKARKGKMVSALVRGLETDGAEHARRTLEVINALPDASEILCDAFTSSAVNVQVNAATGLGMLGNDRVGKGRKALEGARTGGYEPTRVAVRKALEVLDGPREAGPGTIAIDGFETKVLGPDAFGDTSKLRIPDLLAHLQDGRSVVRANAATGLGLIGPTAAGSTVAIAVLLRDDDMRVRLQAAWALDKLGDDAVKEAAPYLVGALRGDAEVGAAVQKVLLARKARMLTALIKGLETDDDTHAKRIIEVINVLPDALEVLLDAFDSPAENVQVNAAIGIGMLGAKRAGTAGRKKLESNRTGGFARTREAVFKGLALLQQNP